MVGISMILILKYTFDWQLPEMIHILDNEVNISPGAAVFLAWLTLL